MEMGGRVEGGGKGLNVGGNNSIETYHHKMSPKTEPKRSFNTSESRKGRDSIKIEDF